jgi:hypothetical protein
MKEIKISAYAGLAYVLFWIIGLILEPGSPGLSSSVEDITAYYQSHNIIHIIQAFLIDGAAAIAIMFFISGLARFFHFHQNNNKTILVSMFGVGLIVASVSMVQGAFQQVLTGTVLASSNVSPLIILSIISYLDTSKLTALAMMVFLASNQMFTTNCFHPWIRWTGLFLTTVILAGGFSYLVNNSILTLALYISLPVLLVWVSAVSFGLLRDPALNRLTETE